jgi:hypothetical protein
MKTVIDDHVTETVSITKYFEHKISYQLNIDTEGSP